MRYLWTFIAGIIVAAIIVLFVPTEDTQPMSEVASAGVSKQASPSMAPIDTDTYVISEGDTLSLIAQRRWGDARLWRRIIELNPGLNTLEEITIGDTISLPDIQSSPESIDLVADLDRSRNERTKEAPVPIRPSIEGDGLDLGIDSQILGATVAPGNIIQDSSGILIADEEYEIPGAGTRDDPYVVSWDLLSSASELYRPRLQQRKIPQRVALLDGAWVTISGYLAFPLPQDTSEMIIMLYQWDGCCIDVPPTPYDAIEVKLNQSAAPGRRHVLKYGSVTGELVVEPYLIEEWLLGLYLMNNATVNMEP